MNRYLLLWLISCILLSCEQTNPDPDPEPDPEPEVDTIPPNAICRDTTLYINECDTVTLLVSDLDAGSTDDFKIDTMWLDRYSFSCEDTGAVQAVTLSVLDTSSNYASCIANVTVIDTTPKPDPYAKLEFFRLVGLMGTSPDHVLATAPGHFLLDTTSLGQREIMFSLSPTNIGIEALLFMIYEFDDFGVDIIGFLDAFSVDDQELFYRLSLLADTEFWYHSSFHGILYYEGLTRKAELFETAADMWKFIVDENISKFDLEFVGSKWDDTYNELLISYMGMDDDIGVGIILPYEAKKSSKNLEVMKSELKQILESYSKN